MSYLLLSFCPHFFNPAAYFKYTQLDLCFRNLHLPSRLVLISGDQWQVVGELRYGYGA